VVRVLTVTVFGRVRLAFKMCYCYHQFSFNCTTILGCLVQEYVGDVINEDTKKQRLAAWAKDNPDDPNYYMMKLEDGWYIDARECGNLSRFINHSCEPNCMASRTCVAGYTRIAIIAIKDIEHGGFLSIDYHFESNQVKAFDCRCGAKDCRDKEDKLSSSNDDEEVDMDKIDKSILIIDERDRKYIDGLKELDREVILNDRWQKLKNKVEYKKALKYSKKK